MHFSRYRRKYKRAKLEKYGLGRAMLRWYYNKRYQEVKNFDKMVVLSQDDFRSWSLHDLPNLTVIPNPLSFEPSEKSPLAAKRVIAIGRLAYAKAFEVLIEIWSKLEQQYPDWKLSIYGKGEKEKLINKTIKAFKQENRVEILPPVVDIRKEILNSSVLAMSSRYEAFGLVLIEAMGCGVPPVAFDCKSGPRDILTDGTDGFLVEFGNKEEFARKLSLLMADQELRQKMGEAAFERSKDFTLDKVMPYWTELFDQLVPDHS